MTSTSTDHRKVVYDRLLFELSLGNHDVYLFYDSPIMIEECIIVRPMFKEKFIANSNKYTLSSHQRRSLAFNHKKDMKNRRERLLIHFNTYLENKKEELVGLGITIATKSKKSLESISTTPDGRIRKIMTLISRALLESPFHKIVCEIVILNIK
ncbi:MAG: hypothetical protein ACW97P_09195 [Candidatus Hodarchaeales archaeon]|jgi:hypothetical protein